VNESEFLKAWESRGVPGVDPEDALQAVQGVIAARIPRDWPARPNRIDWKHIHKEIITSCLSQEDFEAWVAMEVMQ